MTRGIAAGLVLGAFSLALSAAPEHFTIVPERTVPVYEVSRFALPPLHGRFERVSGGISLDAEAHEGSISIEIDATTASIGRGWFDDLLRGEDFFDVARFPRVRFRASRLEFEGDRPVRAAGELTLRGTTLPLTLELRRFACAPGAAPRSATCAAEIVGRISRSAYGMTSYAGLIGDEVRLMIRVEAARDAPLPTPEERPWR